MSKRCGAKTRTGQPCKSWAMPNGRCRMHGGKSLGGIASPLFKTGRYSRFLPERLTERYQEAQEDRELLTLRDDIALVDVQITDLLSCLKDASDQDDGTVWDEVLNLIEQRRKLVMAESRRLVQMRQFLTVEEAMVLAVAIVATIKKHISDRHILAAISADINALVTVPARDNGSSSG